jgi:hypothetical protein
VSWIRDTGELYVCRADGYDGSCTDVSVLAVLPREADVDALLAGGPTPASTPRAVLARRAPAAAAAYAARHDPLTTRSARRRAGRRTSGPGPAPS